jgi:rhodanese-related sulfurtransferase
MKWPWLLLLLAGCASIDPAPDPVRLTPREVRDRRERGEPVHLVCAYEAKKCRGTHPEGTVTLEDFDRRPPPENELAVFFCGCPGEESALRSARGSGRANVAVLDGGIAAWIAEGFPMDPRAPASRQESPDAGLPWIEDLAEAERAAAASGRPLVVCYVAAWCDSCRRFRKRTLAAPEIVELRDRFVWALVDLDRDPSHIRARKLRGTPTTDLVDPEGVTRARVSGFLPAAAFRRHLEEFEADVHRGPGDLRTPKEVTSPDEPGPSELPKGFRADGICFSNVGYGPLRLPSLSPFQSLRHGLTPRTPSTLAEGQVEIQWTESWANLWAFNQDDHLVDYEALHSNISIAYGLTGGIQVELGFLQKSRFGGVMDGFIEGFHDLFGLDQGGREDFERNDFGVNIVENGTSAVQLSDDDIGSFSESIVATIQHNLTCGTRSIPAIAYGVSVRPELGEQEDMTEAEFSDLTLSISVSKRFGDFFGYVGFGYSWYGREKFGAVELRETQAAGLLAVEWQVANRASLVLQCLVSQGVAKDLREFSDPSYEVTFGGKFEIVPRVVLEAGLIENVITFDNSPDFGLHMGILFRP